MNAHLRAALVTVAVLGLAGCGGGEEEAAPPAATQPATQAATTDAAPATTAAPPALSPAEIRITIAGGRPQGGIRRETVKQGERVALVVESDVAGLVHLHGYDLEQGVAPGKPARLEFAADLVGRFEVELEDTSVQIADLEVRP